MSKRCALSVMIALTLCAGSVCFGAGVQGLPESLLKEVVAPERLPEATYTSVKSWPAATAAHRTGRVVDDPEAEGGKALEARPEVDAPDMMLFGPYIEVQPGDYVAFFRVKLLEPLDDDNAGQIDACVGFGQGILFARDIGSEDLQVGRYVQVPLPFHYVQGKLECRMAWSGSAGVRADRVSLFKLEGANMALGAWRAAPATLSGQPKDLAYREDPRPFPDIFPRSAPPAKTLLVCDLRKERADMRLLMYCLQGLVNRKQPQLYCLSVATDAFWLENMQQRGWVEKTENVARPQELLERFRDTYKGIIITDPALPASKNVATMLASIKDGLPASPRLAKLLNLPVLDDLRGRWKTSAEAYRWAFDNLWGSLNHHVIACCWPEHLALRDYLVQQRVFIFWLSGPIDGAHKYASPTDEARLMEQLLAKMPANIPVMSYPYAGQDVGIGEGPGVSLFAEFGKYLVGSIDCANLSVHSGLPVPEPHQQPAPPTPELHADKVYVSFIMSDGDNLPVLTTGNFPQLWQDKVRGRFPMGWTVSPSARILIPDVLAYYYRTATPGDQFLGAVSGVGYTYPDLYGKRFRDPDRKRVYDEFLDQTAAAMKRGGLKDLWIMNATRPEIISRYAERIPFLDALFPDYGRRLTVAADVTYPTARNVPVFHAVTGWREDATREEKVTEFVNQVRRMTPAQRPAFLHLFIWNWGAEMPILEQALKDLGPEYVAVRPDHLAALWRQAMQKQQVVMRLTAVTASIEGQPVTIKGTIRNVSDHALSVALSLREGLDAATVTPPRAELQPGQEVPVALSGRPTGERATLEVSGPFGERTAEAELHRVRVAEVLGRLPAGVELIPAAYVEGEDLGHRYGHEARDPEASGGSVWLARKGEDTPGHIAYGPYQPLEAGKYLALFRLKRESEGEGQLAQLDTCVGGGSPQTGVRNLQAAELPVGEFRWVPLVFEHPGGAYETRVLWSGSATLALDCVGVWKMQGR